MMQRLGAVTRGSRSWTSQSSRATRTVRPPLALQVSPTWSISSSRLSTVQEFHDNRLERNQEFRDPTIKFPACNSIRQRLSPASSSLAIIQLRCFGSLTIKSHDEESPDDLETDSMSMGSLSSHSSTSSVENQNETGTNASKKKDKKSSHVRSKRKFKRRKQQQNPQPKQPKQELQQQQQQQLEQKEKRQHQHQQLHQKSSRNDVLRQELEQLFDEVAPLVQINKLESFVSLLESKHTLQQRQKLVEKSTKLSAAEAMSSKTTKSSSDDDYELLLQQSARDPKSWMHSKILSFLDILPLHARPVKTMASPADEHQKTIPQTAAMLAKAREYSVQSNEMAWSRNSFANKKKPKNHRKSWHVAKSKETLKQESREFAKLLAERLPSHKYNSLVRFFDAYVQLQEQKQSEVVNNNETDKSNEQEEKEEETEKTKSPRKRVKRGAIRLLFNNVELKLGGHVHLIAPELAKFFYFDPPTSSTNRSDKKKSQETSSPSESSIAFKELKVIESDKKWQKYRERFVHKMLALHQQIHNAPPMPTAVREDVAVVDDDDDHDHDDYDDDDDFSISSDASTASMDDRNQEEKLADIVTTNMQKNVRADPDDEESVQESKSSVPRSKRQVHLIFDARVVDEYRDNDYEYPVTADTTVFVDNLPIDVTENEVAELYSRCGALESIEIFNQRPDLDPGPLSTAKLRAMAQQKRKQRAKFNISKQLSVQQNGAGRWARPRTPVYAMLNFADEESMQAASNDSLRIFGMIIRGHSVRSVRAKELTRLYIDNIGPLTGSNEFRTAIDIEASLSQLLSPDIYVSLDISSSAHRKSTRVVPGSCEIMFPAFEVAFDAFCKLREDLSLVKYNDLCSINLLKTPGDAMLYWKRELGGVV